MDGKERFAEAKNHAKMKFEFYVHLVIYLVVIGGLSIINLLTSPGYFWFIWPAMGWGIALLLHGASAFILSSKKDELIDTLARRELDKQHSEHH